MDYSEIVMTPELWSGLPIEIQDYLLSFLTVPVQCRFQTVCKRWDSLIRTASFKALTMKHAKPDAYILGRVAIPRTVGYGLGEIISDSPGWRLLDVEARRWYWIKSHNRHDESDQGRDRGVRNESTEYEPRSLSMDGGFACTFNAYSTAQLQGTEALTCVITNPVAGVEIVRLPDSPFANQRPAIDGREMRIPFLTKMVVEHVRETSTQYKVYVMCCALTTARDEFNEQMISLVVYDSTTSSWRRSAVNLAEQIYPRFHNPMAIVVRCIAVFQGCLYAVLTNPSPFDDNGFWELWRFSPDADSWTEVTSKKPMASGCHTWFQIVYPQLVVSGDRLFLATWVERLHLIAFEVVEIMLNNGGRGPLVIRLSKDEMEAVFETDFSEQVAGPRGAARVVLGRAGPRNEHEAAQAAAARTRRNRSHCFTDSPDVAVFGFAKSIVLMAKKSGVSREIDLERNPPEFKMSEWQPLAQAPQSCATSQVWYGPPMSTIISHGHHH